MKGIAIAAAMMSTLGAGRALSSSYDDLNTGIHFYNLKQWGTSISEFDKALVGADLLPDQQFIAHMDRGLAHQAMLDYELALTDYSACLALQPKSVPTLFARATVYRDIGKFADETSDLDTLIALRPTLAAAYTMRAASDARLGEAEQSIADSKKILSLLPGDYVRNVGTGIIAWQAGETGVAEGNFSYAASEVPGNSYAWLWLTLTEVRLGKTVSKENSPSFDGSSWPAPIISFFVGDASQESVFAAAGTGEDSLTLGHICEANFYVGEWLLLHHDPSAAQPMIQKAAADCPIDFVEWSPAQLALAGFRR